MGLPSQTVDIPLGGGIEQRRTDYLLAPPKVSTLENLDFAEEGGYRVRDGLSQVAFSGLPSGTHNSIASYKGALYLNSLKDGMFVRNSALAAATKLNESAPIPLSAVVEELVRPFDGISDIDSVAVGNFLIVAWNPGEGTTSLTRADNALKDVYILVLDRTDFSVVVKPTVVQDLGFGVKCAAFDTSKVAVTAVETNGELNTVIVNTSTSPPSIGTLTQIATGVGTDTSTELIRRARFDTHGSTTKTYFNIVYWDQGNTRVTALKVSNTPSVLASLNKVTTMDDGITIYHGIVQQKVYVAGSDGTNVNCFTIEEDYASSGAVNALFTDTKTAPIGKVTLVDKDGSSLWCAWSTDRVTSAQIHEVKFTDVTSAGAQTGTVGRLFGGLLASKAFLPSGYLPHVVIRPAMFLARQEAQAANGFGNTTHTCLMLATVYTPTNIVPTDGQAQSSTIVNTNPRLKIVGKFVQDKVFPQEEGPATGGHLPSVSLLTGVTWAFACQVNDNNMLVLPGPGADTNTKEGVGADLVKFNFSPGVLSYATVSEISFVSGAVPCTLDGSFLLESHPMVAPAYPQVILEGAGSTVKKDTKYKAIWFWVDAKGNAHRSVPSLEIDSVTSDQTGVTLRFQYPPTNLDGQNGRLLLLAVYRKDPLDSLFQLHSFANGKYFHNPVDDHSTTVNGYIEIKDTAAQSTSSEPSIYTSDGTLDSVCPPAASHSVVVAGRVFLIPGEDPQSVWASSPPVSGIAPEFNEETVVYFPDAKDSLVGLGQLDDKCVVFAKDAIWFIAGQGPSKTGIGSFLVNRVSSDIGCVNKNSIVSGSFGIMFEADKGIYNLTRSLELVYVGAGVEDDVKSTTILRTIVLDDRHQVRFLQATRVLVYDYLVEQWTKFVYAFTEAPMLGVDILYHESDFYLYDNARGFAKEAVSTTTDLGARIVPKLTTAWIKLDGIQNFARIKRIHVLGSNDTTGGNITVKLARNYDPTIYQTDKWRKTDRSAGDRLQVRVHNSRQKLESLQITVDGSTIDATGFDLHAEYTITGIALEVALKKGLHKDIPLTDRS